MTKSKYHIVRESIRTNGIAYTTRIACTIGDIDAVSICDALTNIRKSTDWLRMRANWMRNPCGDTKAAIIRLTSPIV